VCAGWLAGGRVGSGRIAQLVKLLLRHGADPTLTNTLHQRAAHVATDTHVIHLLLDATEHLPTTRADDDDVTPHAAAVTSPGYRRDVTAAETAAERDCGDDDDDDEPLDLSVHKGARPRRRTSPLSRTSAPWWGGALSRGERRFKGDSCLGTFFLGGHCCLVGRCLHSCRIMCFLQLV